MLKINWKLRLKNPAFWLGVIPLLAILVQVVGKPFGLDMATVTGIEDYLIAIVNAVFGVLSFLGITADPTTKNGVLGLNDSTQAMEYDRPEEDF